MRLEKKNGFRILYPDYGYLLRNIKTGDIYDGKIYLGVNAPLDIYEDIRDESISEGLLISLNDVKTKEDSLNKIGKIVANQVTDDAVALTIQEFYDIWEAGIHYQVGKYVTFNDILYKVLTEHTSQTVWTPDASPGLFAKVLIDPTGETIPEWAQPDSTNAYMTGDKVKHNEQIYISTIDNNVWEPGVYGWEIVKEE